MGRKRKRISVATKASRNKLRRKQKYLEQKMKNLLNRNAEDSESFEVEVKVDPDAMKLERGYDDSESETDDPFLRAGADNDSIVGSSVCFINENDEDDLGGEVYVKQERDDEDDSCFSNDTSLDATCSVFASEEVRLYRKRGRGRPRKSKAEQIEERNRKARERARAKKTQLTPEEIEERNRKARERARLKAQEKRDKMTPEQIEERNRKARERMRRKAEAEKALREKLAKAEKSGAEVGPSLKEKLEKQEKQRQYEKEKYLQKKAKMTPEQIEERNRKARERARLKKNFLTPEQIEERNRKARERARMKKKTLTPEQIERNKQRRREREQNMTEEQRRVRNQKAMLRKMEKMAKMTEDDKREMRMKGYMQRMAQLARMTPEEREAREKRRKENYMKNYYGLSKEDLQKVGESFTSTSAAKARVKKYNERRKEKLKREGKWKEWMERLRIKALEKRKMLREQGGATSSGTQKRRRTGPAPKYPGDDPKERSRIRNRIYRQRIIARRKLIVQRALEQGLTPEEITKQVETPEHRAKRLRNLRLRAAVARLRKRLTEAGASQMEIEAQVKDLRENFEPIREMRPYKPKKHTLEPIKPEELEILREEEDLTLPTAKPGTGNDKNESSPGPHFSVDLRSGVGLRQQQQQPTTYHHQQPPPREQSYNHSYHVEPVPCSSQSWNRDSTSSSYEVQFNAVAPHDYSYAAPAFHDHDFSSYSPPASPPRSISPDPPPQPESTIQVKAPVQPPTLISLLNTAPSNETKPAPESEEPPRKRRRGRPPTLLSLLNTAPSNDDSKPAPEAAAPEAAAPESSEEPPRKKYRRGRPRKDAPIVVKPRKYGRHKRFQDHVVRDTVCDECGHAYSYQYIYEHKNRVHNKNFNYETRECRVCLKQFADVLYFCTHYRQEHGGGRVKKKLDPSKAHVCDICGNAYERLATLQIHKKSKHEGVVYTCEFCPGRTFTQMSYFAHKYYKHKSNFFHPGLHCAKCEDTFRTSVQTRDHVERYHPDSFFTCEFCNAYKYTEIGMRTHKIATCNKITKEGKAEAMKEDKDKDLLRLTMKCEFCPRKVSCHSMGRHYWEMHNVKEDVFNCNICKCRPFKWRHYYFLHLVDFHGLKVEDMIDEVRKLNVKDRDTVEVKNLKGKMGKAPLNPFKVKKSGGGVQRKKRKEEDDEGDESKKVKTKRRRPKKKKVETDEEEEEAEETGTDSDSEEEDLDDPPVRDLRKRSARPKKVKSETEEGETDGQESEGSVKRSGRPKKVKSETEWETDGQESEGRSVKRKRRRRRPRKKMSEDEEEGWTDEDDDNFEGEGEGDDEEVTGRERRNTRRIRRSYREPGSEDEEEEEEEDYSDDGESSVGEEEGIAATGRRRTQEAIGIDPLNLYPIVKVERLDLSRITGFEDENTGGDGGGGDDVESGGNAED